MAAAAGYLHQPLLVLVPLALAGILMMIQYPQLLLYGLLASIPWSIEYNVSPSLGTDLPDEPLMLLLSFAVLAWMASRAEWKKAWQHPLLLIVLLQLGWMLVALATSTQPLISAKYVLAKCWYLLAFVAAPLIWMRDEKVLKRSAVVLAASMLLLMFVALVRHAQYGWTFEKINDALAPFFRNHVNYSALLTFTLPLQVAFYRSSGSKGVKGLLLLLMLLTAVAIYFSFARGAWLALLAGVITYWLVRKRWLVKAYIIAMLLTLAAVLWLRHEDNYLKFAHDYNTTVFHTDFREHLLATVQLKDVSSAERYYRWIAGVRMIRDSWQTGLGPNTFYHNYKSYTIPAFKTWVSRNEERSTVHNYLLLLIIEQGVIGLLLFVILIGLLFRYIQDIYHRTDSRFWKVAVQAAAAILVMICTVNFLSDLIETDKIGSIFYTCIAVIIIADRKTRNISKAAPHIERIA